MNGPQITGMLLILGSLITPTGASLYMVVKDPKGPMIFGQPPREWLRLVGEHQAAWRWATIFFLAGSIISLVGLLGLTGLLLHAGDPGLAAVGFLLFLLGNVFWIIILAARLTVDPWAAKELARMDVIPESYTALSSWMGALFTLYTIPAFAGLACYGGAMLVSSGVLPLWLGWLALASAALGLLQLALTRDSLPALHFVIPAAIGVTLLIV